MDGDNVEGPWEGKSWDTAYRTLREGIDAVEKAGTGEVWVAQGTYRPTSNADRTVSFQLKSGVALYGGFKGTETKRKERDWKKRVTILSGHIGKPGDTSDNSYHVVKGADNATIDRFIITGGNADGDLYDTKGPGMANFNKCNPVVTECTFTGNSADTGKADMDTDASCVVREGKPDWLRLVPDESAHSPQRIPAAEHRTRGFPRGGFPGRAPMAPAPTAAMKMQYRDKEIEPY